MTKCANLYKVFCSLIIFMDPVLGQAQPVSPGVQANQYLQQQRINESLAAQRQQEQRIRAQQQWQAEENAIQAKIAKYRATPYYGSLAVDPANPGALAWSGGGKVTRAIAERAALEQCGKPGCVILATSVNSCIAAVKPDNISGIGQWVLFYDKDPREAVSKAAAICAKKYGLDRCVLSTNNPSGDRNTGNCSGYDYGAYEQYQ